jgi:hypothetical protein
MSANGPQASAAEQAQIIFTENELKEFQRARELVLELHWILDNPEAKCFPKDDSLNEAKQAQDFKQLKAFIPKVQAYEKETGKKYSNVDYGGVLLKSMKFAGEKAARFNIYDRQCTKQEKAEKLAAIEIRKKEIAADEAEIAASKAEIAAGRERARKVREEAQEFKKEAMAGRERLAVLKEEIGVMKENYGVLWLHCQKLQEQAEEHAAKRSQAEIDVSNKIEKATANGGARVSPTKG